MSGLSKIEREANTLITATLQEQNSVWIPAIGRLEPKFHPEYILTSSASDGSTTQKLIPPHISLSLTPSDYLLQRKHYTKVDFTPPLEFWEESFISNLSDLYSFDQEEANSELTTHLRELLKDLFRGRRTTLLELGDLYITEEREDNLLINFIASEELLKSLNFVFSAYQDVEINPGVNYPDTEIRSERHENSVLQISIPKEKIEPAPPEQVEEKSESDLSHEESEHNEPEDGLIATPITTDVSSSEPVATTPNEVEQKKEGGQKRRGVYYFLLVACIIGVVLFFLTRHERSISNEPVVAEASQHINHSKTEPTTNGIKSEEQQPLVPLDTITVERGTTLAKLSRAYYNSSYYWIYIYFANHEKIEDPNNLEIGQELVILPLEHYKLLEDPEEALREAKEWSMLIQLHKYTSYEEQRPTLPIYKERGRAVQ